MESGSEWARWRRLWYDGDDGVWLVVVDPLQWLRSFVAFTMYWGFPFDATKSSIIVGGVGITTSACDGWPWFLHDESVLDVPPVPGDGGGGTTAEDGEGEVVEEGRDRDRIHLLTADIPESNEEDDDSDDDEFCALLLLWLRCWW